MIDEQSVQEEIERMRQWVAEGVDNDGPKDVAEVKENVNCK